MSIWWPGVDPWGSARHSLKELHGAAVLRLPPGGIGIGVGCIANRAAGTGGSTDVECHLYAREGTGAGAVGGAVLTDIVGLTSMYSTGSGTKLLDRGWILSFSGPAQGESAGQVWGYSQAPG